TSRGGETKSTNRRGRSSVVRTRGGGAFAMAWRSLRPEKLTYAKPTSCTRKKGTTIVAFHAPLANPGVTIVLFHSAPSAPRISLAMINRPAPTITRLNRAMLRSQRSKYSGDYGQSFGWVDAEKFFSTYLPQPMTRRG